MVQAFVYAERDVNLDEALKLTERAAAYIHKLSQTAVKNRCDAAYADCKGWILYKQNTIDEAIVCLEQAVSLVVASASAYFHLALAYEGKLEKTLDKRHRRLLLAKTRAYCQLRSGNGH